MSPRSRRSRRALRECLPHTPDRIVLAAPIALQRAGLTLADMDLIEPPRHSPVADMHSGLATLKQRYADLDLKCRCPKTDPKCGCTKRAKRSAQAVR